MKRILTTLLLPLAPLHAKDEVANAPTTGDVRDVRVVRTADQEPRASLLGQPTIALWKEKQLVVAYQKGIAGKHDMGSIDATTYANYRQEDIGCSIVSVRFTMSEVDEMAKALK